MKWKTYQDMAIDYGMTLKIEFWIGERFYLEGPSGWLSL